VVEGVTGHVAASADEFAARALRVLSDDAQWRMLHEGCKNVRENGWPAIAAAWEKQFLP
jgi:hypothetical protein